MISQHNPTSNLCAKHVTLTVTAPNGVSSFSLTVTDDAYDFVFDADATLSSGAVTARSDASDVVPSPLRLINSIQLRKEHTPDVHNCKNISVPKTLLLHRLLVVTTEMVLREFLRAHRRMVITQVLLRTFFEAALFGAQTETPTCNSRDVWSTNLALRPLQVLRTRLPGMYHWFAIQSKM